MIGRGSMLQAIRGNILILDSHREERREEERGDPYPEGEGRGGAGEERNHSWETSRFATESVMCTQLHDGIESAYLQEQRG
jgi:hypothetical protein